MKTQIAEPKTNGAFTAESCMGLTYVSRDQPIAAGELLEPGEVLGRLGHAYGGQFAALQPSAHDGTEDAAAIALKHIDARTGETVGRVITRGPMAVPASDLTWPAGITDEQKARAVSQLDDLGIWID